MLQAYNQGKGRQTIPKSLLIFCRPCSVALVGSAERNTRPLRITLPSSFTCPPISRKFAMPGISMKGGEGSIDIVAAGCPTILFLET